MNKTVAPLKWEIYGHFGQAVQVAQLLERVLAFYIEVFEMYERRTIKKPDRDEIMAKLERMTFGQLKKRFEKYLPGADPNLIAMLQDALTRRNELIHRFFITYEKEVKNESTYPMLIAKLQDEAQVLDKACKFFVRAMQKTKQDVAKHFKENL